MIKKLINQISDLKRKFHKEMSNPLSVENLQNFLRAVRKNINYELPQGYLNILLSNNGIIFNGLEIYKADNYESEVSGFLDMNETWHASDDDLKNYIFFAEADIAWYVFDVVNMKYYELDKPSGEIMEVFDTFEDMIIKALKGSLYLNDDME